MVTYRVTAAAVLVRLTGADLIIERGRELPAQAPADLVDRLLRKGMIEPIGAEAPESPETPEPGLSDLSAAELKALAAERGIAVPKSANKAALIEALKAPAAEGAVVEPRVADLLAQAAARGIDVPDGVTDRDDLIALLNQ